jgi:hypothetical protein
MRGKGGRLDALALLAILIECRRTHPQREVPGPLLDYLAAAFDGYMREHESGDRDARALRRHLLLEPEAHRPRGSVPAEHDLQVVAVRFFYYVKVKGLSKTAARNAVCKDLNLADENVVKRAANELPQLADFEADELARMAGIDRT